MSTTVVDGPKAKTGGVRTVAVDDGKFALTFTRTGNLVAFVPPNDFGPDDWALSSRVVGAVRRELDAVTEPLPIVGNGFNPAADHTQPIAVMFQPGRKL